MKVGWGAKAIAFNFFDRAPYGEKLYYFFQKNVTKTYPRQLVPTAQTANVQIRHAGVIRNHRADVSSLTLMEFGAGWDLYSNFIYYCYGINHQFTLDLRRWARAETINSVIAHLQKDPPPGHVRVPQTLVRDDRLEEDLEALYGIRYHAPFDASRTGFDARSIDVITTTSVFEHVPAPICGAILSECRRIIRDDGLMSHTIDYSDHYAHADPSITSYNLLRFGPNMWKLVNPGIHYQNRLRTPDFLGMFRRAGFEVVDCEEWLGKREEFERARIHPSFGGYDEAELRALGAHFLLNPA